MICMLIPGERVVIECSAQLWAQIGLMVLWWICQVAVQLNDLLWVIHGHWDEKMESVANFFLPFDVSLHHQISKMATMPLLSRSVFFPALKRGEV